MTSSDLIRVEPLDQERLGQLYLLRQARGAPLLGLHSRCWIAGRHYRVVGLFDLNDGAGPQACVVPLDGCTAATAG